MVACHHAETLPDATAEQAAGAVAPAAVQRLALYAARRAG
jgi:hypothetical protein